MALDELHARRLATIGNLFDAALDRMELVVRSAEAVGEGPRMPAEQGQLIRDRMSAIRRRLHDGLHHFSIRQQKPQPKQLLIAELSTLWVVLENARPERMSGYGVELDAQDRAALENLIEALINETDLLRNLISNGTAIAKCEPSK